MLHLVQSKTFFHVEFQQCGSPYTSFIVVRGCTKNRQHKNEDIYACNDKIILFGTDVFEERQYALLQNIKRHVFRYQRGKTMSVCCFLAERRHHACYNNFGTFRCQRKCTAWDVLNPTGGQKLQTKMVQICCFLAHHACYNNFGTFRCQRKCTAWDVLTVTD